MKFSITYFLLIISFNCISQNIVIDSATNKGIPYTNISLKNTQIGFYSNNKGQFTLKEFIRGGDTIVFSSLGYKSKELIVGRGIKIDTIKLVRKIERLNEVIISKPKKYEIENIGVKDKKNSSFTLGSIKLAVFIKNNSKNKEGIIQQLIYRKLKVKSQYTVCDTTNGIKCKTYKIKPKRDLAIKLQLYKINDSTQLPDLNYPLIKKDIYIRLNKSKTIKYDISNLKIFLPEDGVFMYLEVLGVFNDNGEIVSPKHKNIFSFGTHKLGNKNEIITYGKYKNRDWHRNLHENALFSMNVAYPIY